MQDLDRLYRHLIDSSTVGAWVLDPSGRTVWSNPVMATFLGRPERELFGFPAREAFDEQGQRQLEAFLERMRAGAGSEPTVECLLQRPDGSSTWVLITASTMADEESSLFILRVVDYDQRRLLHDELTQSQALGRMGSWRHDYASGASWWSEELYRVLGRDLADGPTTLDEFSALVVEEDRHLVDVQREVGPFATEVRFRRPGGEVIWLGITGLVHGAPDGRRTSFLATLQENTNQKTLELRLRESLETSVFLRAIANAANKSATLAEILDLSLKQMQAADPAARLTTFTPVPAEDGSVALDPTYAGRDYSGLSVEQLTPTAREAELAREAYHTLATVTDEGSLPGRVLVARAVTFAGEVVVVVVLAMVDDGASRERWLTVSAAAAAAAERVMERERVNAELGRARDAAMAASRQKSSFLATMSHEIRTPMNGVIGLNDLLLHTPLDANQRRLAEGVQAAGHSLLAVINDILDFSKIEAGKLELESTDFEVRQLIDNVLTLQGERAHAKGIELAADVHSEVPTFVRGDPTRFSQILTNLVSNAVKFTATGEVIVTCRPDAGPPETEDPSGAGVLLRVEVVDTGIGIPRELQEGLFEPFAQAEESTTRKFGGTGLGLAICRQLVAAIGGEIGVDSEPGAGSSFWFTGRFGVGDPVLTPHPGREARHVLEGRRVLVVDDNASNRRILAEVLTGWHVSVESAADAEEAVDRVHAAATRGEPFDVVLLDLVMPGLSGLDLASMITASTDEPRPTMMLLSSAQSVDRADLDAAGIRRSLTKPVGRSALFDELVGVLAGVHGVEGLTEASTPPPAKRLDRRILVVEDNEINQMVALGVLDALGYSAEVASDGEAALAMTARTRYDAIVMDVQMPGMDGYTATRAIRSRENGTDRVPIIAMTAAAVEGESERCLAAGMDSFLTKPLQPRQLEETLRVHVADRHGTVATPGEDDDPTRPEVLDRSRLDILSAVGPGASVLVNRAIERFVDQSGDTVLEMRQAAARGAGEELTALAHRLGGSAANLGVNQVAARCGELERRGPQEDDTRASALLDAVEVALAPAIRALRAVEL